MDAHSLRPYAETRAQSDSKHLKKTIRDFYALLAGDARGDKLLAAHSILTVGLDQLEQQLGKTKRIEIVTHAEIQEYRREVAQLEQTSEETRQRLVDLRKRLEEAQQERARRIEYDAIAKTISKLPDRTKGKESLDKLNGDIELLRQEERTYSETWQTRKVAFDGIVSSLEAMQEAIRDEKAEQERRRALDEDEADAGAQTSAVGGDNAASGAQDDASRPQRGDDTGDATNTPQRAASLDPNAKVFVPGPSGGEASGEGEDIEMRDPDTEEEPRRGTEAGASRTDDDARRTDREEGQMTDDREEGEM